MGLIADAIGVFSSLTGGSSGGAAGGVTGIVKSLASNIPVVGGFAAPLIDLASGLFEGFGGPTTTRIDSQIGSAVTTPGFTNLQGRSQVGVSGNFVGAAPTVTTGRVDRRTGRFLGGELISPTGVTRIQVGGRPTRGASGPRRLVVPTSFQAAAVPPVGGGSFPSCPTPGGFHPAPVAPRPAAIAAPSFGRGSCQPQVAAFPGFSNHHQECAARNALLPSAVRQFCG